MDKKEIIENFLSSRPDTVGVYGYGSGVIKQDDVDIKDNPQIDLIIVTDNIKDWHMLNLNLNPDDYAVQGKLRMSTLTREKIKGPNHITYCSQVKDGNALFKYGTIESEDFLNDLSTWETFFVAGRFQKPVLTVKSNVALNAAISKNRAAAFMIACLLSEEVTTYYDLFCLICNLSYLGDIRMGIAENPDKVKNIVHGGYDELLKIYSSLDYVTVIDDNYVKINYDVIMKNLNVLPDELANYIMLNMSLNMEDKARLLIIRKYIINYLSKKNKDESIGQAINGLNNLGLGKVVPYMARKLSKKMKKN